jgi:hypothetical protein
VCSGRGLPASVPLEAALPVLAERKLPEFPWLWPSPATVPWSVPAFLLDKATVGPRSSGEVGSRPLPEPGAASDKVNELKGHNTSVRLSK